MVEVEQRVAEPIAVAIRGDVLCCELRHGALEQQWWGPGHTSVLRGAMRLAQRRGCRAVMLSGLDGVFWHTLAGVPATQRVMHGDAVAEACAYLERCELPTIALVNGLCEGVGLALALHCDHVVAVRRRETRLWIAHALGLSSRWSHLMRRLVARVGVDEARALAEDALVLDADRALALGLVDAVVEAEEEAHKLLLPLPAAAPLASSGLPALPDEAASWSAARLWSRRHALWLSCEEEAPEFGALLVMERLARHVTTQHLCEWLEAVPTRGLCVMRTLSQAPSHAEGRVIGALLSSYDQPPPRRGVSSNEDITIHNILTRELPWRGRQLLTHHLPLPLEVLPVVECAQATRGQLMPSHRAWRVGLQRAGLHVLTTRPRRMFVLEQLIVALCRGLLWGESVGCCEPGAQVGWLVELGQPLQRLIERELGPVAPSALSAALMRPDLEGALWAMWGQGAQLIARGEVAEVAEIEGFILLALGCRPSRCAISQVSGQPPDGLLDPEQEAALFALCEAAALAQRGPNDWSPWIS
jgi:enoyl-CoA hydratase/carnithine racemase